MTRLVFVDVDDTLLTPPYAAVKRVATFLGKKFPAEEAFLKRSAVEYHKAFPELFRGPGEMWAIALLSLPFGHFRSQAAMAFDMERISELLADHRLYLLSKNPPSFTRWRVQRLRQLFRVRFGDRYIACGPILKKGPTKLSIMGQVAVERGVQLADCLLVDDSVENVREALAAGARCALVRSSWNAADVDALQRDFAHLQVVDSTALPQVIGTHLQNDPCPDVPSHFIVPPLGLRNGLRLGRVFLQRWWLYSEPLPKPAQIVPVARNPWSSFFYRDPQADICARMEAMLAAPGGLAGARLLPLKGGGRPALLPLSLKGQLRSMPADERVRHVRTVCRDALRARGHHFVRDAMFYFTALVRQEEKSRILGSERVAQAKRTYAQTHDVSDAVADGLAGRYVEELLTSRSYVSCLFGEWVLDTILGKIFKHTHLKTHPEVRNLEHDHFLFYAATHRSYLDSAVLWSILSHNGQSFPFAVGADKMRKVWFGRLGIRGGTFFLRRKFIDVIYAAVIAEHVTSMQKPGSVLEVFLEGQRSRSGLTLPPKKGIASIVWDNMGPHSKVAIVPVSFTYNKIPESEKLIKERYDERQRQGEISLREQADMKIRQGRRKSRLEKVRAAWRRMKSPKISECYVHFAKPIVLNKAAADANLQEDLNEAMRRINAATAILPSSVLCLCLLGAEHGHTTFAEASAFLHFSRAVVGLYELPSHLAPGYMAQNPDDDVRAFLRLPFVNRKFKRAGMDERTLICVDELDVERASYYKNNVLHFFVLPAILSYVLTDVQSGRIEELHRCFDHMFAKLQATYFLPKVASTHVFIDAFLQLMAERGHIAVADNRWVINDQQQDALLLHVLSNLGADLVQGDLPNLMDIIRRASNRVDVHVTTHLAAEEVSQHAQAKLTGLTPTNFYVQCEAPVQIGDHVRFVPEGADTHLLGSIVRVDVDGVEVRQQQDKTLSEGGRGPGLAPASPHSFAAQPAGSGVWQGTVTFTRAQAGAGVIKNLSPSGAFITTNLRLAAGARVRCSLGQEQDVFEVHGKVARVTETGVGVHFDALTEEGRARLILLGSKPAP